MANPNLEWEKTAAFNLGLDFGFLNDRISGSVDYYSMKTHDMIMGQRLPPLQDSPASLPTWVKCGTKGLKFSLVRRMSETKYWNGKQA